MKRSLVLLALTVLIFTTKTNAQSMGHTYRTALGIKFWDGAGVSIKHFLQENRSIEGVGFFWSHGARITGLYEFNWDITGAPGLKFYAGPGMHLGFYHDDYYYRDHYHSGTYVGIDGVLGLDYKINKVPINVSIDWQPSWEFGDSGGFYGSWGGIGVRYTF